MDQKLDRYYRLSRVASLGPSAVRRLRRGSVLIAGCGALGTVAASLLVRSGVGRVRLIDRDVVEESNLTDQNLYTEADADEHRFKAQVAAERLSALNREVVVEGRVADIGYDNAESLLEGCDLIIDGTDNLYTKYLLNDLAVATNTPWVYAGCAGLLGTILAIVPGRTHCMRCLWPEPPPSAWVEGCESMGLLGTTAAVVGAIQVTEAMKILLGRSSELFGGPISIDIWDGRYRKIPVPAFSPESNPCPACGARDFPYLRGEGAPRAAVMCGRKAVLITPNESALDYAGVETRLAERLSVFRGPGFVRFKADGCEVVLYASGRALIFGTGDPVKAQALYGRYVTS